MALAEQFRVHSTKKPAERKWHLLERANDMFGGILHKPDAPDLKLLHTKFYQVALENHFSGWQTGHQVMLR